MRSDQLSYAPLRTWIIPEIAAEGKLNSGRIGRMDLKQQAALAALQFVQSGMRLGLGTGSTTRLFIQALGERCQAGVFTGLRCVPTSQETALQAQSLGLEVVSLASLGSGDSPPVLDLAVDGADEVDPRLNLIKGLGKAALREKMVEMHARKLVIIVDENKLVHCLGRGPLPVEIVPFEAEMTVAWLCALATRAELWLDPEGRPVHTDNHNWLVRCWFEGGIADPELLDRRLNDRPGVVGHGLFLGMAHTVIVAGQEGVRLLAR